MSLALSLHDDDSKEFGGPPGGVSAPTLAGVCDSLLARCLELGSKDNLSVIIVILGQPTQAKRRATLTAPPCGSPRVQEMRKTIAPAPAAIPLPHIGECSPTTPAQEPINVRSPSISRFFGEEADPVGDVARRLESQFDVK